MIARRRADKAKVGAERPIVLFTDWSRGRAMDAPSARMEFDAAERERIRAALLRYMEEHRVGVPTLQYRIIKADEPRHREIPLSTLQRFLGRKHQTQEHHVVLCHAFVKELPYYGEGRDIAQFGTAFFGFLNTRLQGGEREALAARLKSEFAGSYEAAGTHLTLEDAGDEPYLLARERSGCVLAAEYSEEQAQREVARRRRMREGVMVLIAAGIYVALRDSLTRQLRLCSLTHTADWADNVNARILDGEIFQPGFMVGMKSTYQRVRFVPAVAGEDR